MDVLDAVNLATASVRERQAKLEFVLLDNWGKDLDNILTGIYGIPISCVEHVPYTKHPRRPGQVDGSITWDRLSIMIVYAGVSDAARVERCAMYYGLLCWGGPRYAEAEYKSKRKLPVSLEAPRTKATKRGGGTGYGRGNPKPKPSKVDTAKKAGRTVINFLRK